MEAVPVTRHLLSLIDANVQRVTITFSMSLPFHASENVRDSSLLMLV